MGPSKRLAGVWERVVDQVVDQDLMLGVVANTPQNLDDEQVTAPVAYAPSRAELVML